MDEQTQTLIRTAAIDYLAAGLSVLPALPNEKRPSISWQAFQTRLPSSIELDAWFGDANAACIVCGAVSGNLEMIDFDLAGEMYPAWCEAIEQLAPGLLERLVIESTPSGGFHVVYRCDTAVAGNIKLASRLFDADDDLPLTVGSKDYKPRRHDDGRWFATVVMIETRGEGGLFLCAPSPGYELIQGDLAHPPTITAKERETLLSAAGYLDEAAPKIGVESTPAVAASPTTNGNVFTPADVGLPARSQTRPGDDFGERGDIRPYLEQHGWVKTRTGENEYWRRPGKTSGASATLKGGVFYVFSSNAAPFEPQKGYGPFQVFALLEHHGDYSAAAAALGRAGYGDRHRVQSKGMDLSEFFPEPAVATVLPTASGPPSIGSLVAAHPRLRPPVIHGLLREGETMNVIASPKTGKSWLTLDLAIAVATGRPWLERYRTVPGPVLIIDNELHPETSAHRLPMVAEARGVPMRDVAEQIRVDNLRGHLQDIFTMEKYFGALERGRFKIIVLDAFYRFMPVGKDENDNGTMANIYNHIDAFADRLGCCFVLIHHSSKGSQSGKSVTDVGAGAGAQSRATDSHLVLRPHEEEGVVVLDAAVRSWPPIEPTCLRWDFPVWSVDETLDPVSLKSERPGKKKDAATKANKPVEPSWSVERFVARFISAQPVGKAEIREEAKGEPQLSWRRVTDLLEIAENRKLIYRWQVGRAHRVLFATVPQPAPGEEAGP